jgi:putative chitinase
MNPAELTEMMPHAGPRAAIYAEPLTLTMVEFEIDTPKRQAAFLANIAHESGSLRYVEEIASGDAYEGRKDLGNTEPGDGRRFKGRGLPQITGRDNYRACGKALALDLIANPELLEQPLPAARSAGWFWKTKNLAVLADADKFGSLCRIWNGGINGLDDRIQHWLRIRRVLGL